MYTRKIIMDISFLICIQLFIIQAVSSQCVNRIVQGPNGPIEVLPNQMIVPPGAQYPGQPRPVYLPGPNPAPAQPVILPSPGPISTEFLPPNFAPQQTVLPNIQQAVSNLLSGNIFAPNIPQCVPNVPGNVIVPPGNVILPPVNPNIIQGMILPNSMDYAPVLHDNSVANNLANALQLLVVSSLLSTTLPYEPPCYNGYMPGYGYVY